MSIEQFGKMKAIITDCDDNALFELEIERFTYEEDPQKNKTFRLRLNPLNIEPKISIRLVQTGDEFLNADISILAHAKESAQGKNEIVLYTGPPTIEALVRLLMPTERAQENARRFGMSFDSGVAREEESTALKSCRAAIKYDAAIKSCADDPDKMSSYCTAANGSLDALYAEWICLSAKAILEYEKARTLENTENS